MSLHEESNFRETFSDEAWKEHKYAKVKQCGYCGKGVGIEIESCGSCGANFFRVNGRLWDKSMFKESELNNE